MAYLHMPSFVIMLSRVHHLNVFVIRHHFKCYPHLSLCDHMSLDWYYRNSLLFHHFGVIIICHHFNVIMSCHHFGLSSHVFFHVITCHHFDVVIKCHRLSAFVTYYHFVTIALKSS